MNESELREALAPRVAAKLQSRLRGHGLQPGEAEQLAHEIIAMVQGAELAARAARGRDALVPRRDQGGGAS